MFDKCSDGLCVIEGFEAPELKTKSVAKVLGNIKPTGKILLIDDTFEDKFVLASRNIARVNILNAKGKVKVSRMRRNNPGIKGKMKKAIVTLKKGDTIQIA